MASEYNNKDFCYSQEHEMNISSFCANLEDSRSQPDNVKAGRIEDIRKEIEQTVAIWKDCYQKLEDLMGTEFANKKLAQFLEEKAELLNTISGKDFNQDQLHCFGFRDDLRMFLTSHIRILIFARYHARKSVK